MSHVARETLKALATIALLFALVAVPALGWGEDVPGSPFPEPEGYTQPGPNPLEGSVDSEPVINQEPPSLQPYRLNPNDPILRCSRNIEIVEAYVIQEVMLSNGMLGKLVSAKTKKGNVITIAALYPTLGTLYNRETGTITIQTAEFATRYLVDLDNDGNTDAVYEDKHGEGVCGDINPMNMMENPDTKENATI